MGRGCGDVIRVARLAAALAALALILCGCGQDYRPPELDTTGEDAGQLGQVLDIDVFFPDMRLLDRKFPGVSFSIRLEVEGAGFGTHDARATYSDNVEDLSGDPTIVVYTPESWSAGTLGPLRIGVTLFEIVLTGDAEDGAWRIAGRAYETLTATEGSFEAWRRHRFLVAGTDFFSEFGRVSLVELARDGEILVTDNLELVSSDAVLRVTGGAVYAVNRFTFDNLQRLDPQQDFATSWQRSVGDGANPHDVLTIDEDKAYVTRYEPPFDDLAVFDPSLRLVVSTIPLGALAENRDGTPRAARLVRAEGAVFVGLQDIDRSFSDFREGKLAVVDPNLDEVVGVIPLGGDNPGAIEVLRGSDGRVRLYVALAGVFGGLQPQELSGGVVVVDAFNRALEGLALDDDVAGGNIAALAMASDRLGYVVAVDTQFRNSVLAFDPAGGTVLRTLTEGFDFIPELEVDGGGVLAVPDRNALDPRLCLYRIPDDAAAPETLIGCGGLELPPFSIEALD